MVLIFVSFGILVGLEDGSHRSFSSALSHSTDAGTGLSLYFAAVMMLEVLFWTSLTKKKSSISQATTGT